MIAGLKPYPERRNSGVDWLGEVPGHWRVVPLGSLLTIRSEKGRTDLPLLSVLREKGVVRRSDLAADENHNVMPDDLAAYKVARGGDLVINKMKAWQGSLGLAPCDGVVSPAYFVFDLASSNIRFAERMLRSRPYVEQFARASDGVRIGQWDLGIPAMKRIACVVPPEDEQAAIVRFLDHADRRIRRSIAAKQKMIRLLEEQKAAMVQQAVTRGLDPDAPLKASGAQWLGDVPTHWTTKPFLRWCVQRVDYRGKTPDKTDSGVFLVTAKNIRRGWIDYEASCEFVSENDYEQVMRRGKPRLGDLLFTTEAPLGNFALVDRDDVALAQRVIRFRLCPQQCDPEFVLHAVLSPYFQHQLLCRATGSTALGIKASKLPQLTLTLPPLEEQKAIMRWVAAETTAQTSGARLAREEIGLLNEYRARLVADVVTGKLDVRDAAAALSDLASEADVVEEPVESDDDEDVEAVEVEEEFA